MRTATRLHFDDMTRADWVIDLTLEGGGGGGRIVGTGTPERIAGLEDSHTGRYLKEMIGG